MIVARKFVGSVGFSLQFSRSESRIRRAIGNPVGYEETGVDTRTAQ